jgi:ribonuclease HI
MENQMGIFSHQTKISSLSWDIYVDGASRGNPGRAGAGVFVKDKTKPLIKKGFYLGKKTNNQAEYLALAIALFLLQDKHAALKNDGNIVHLVIHSDSLLLVKQLQGLYAIKNPILKELNSCIMKLLQSYSYDIKHVYRAANTIADSLANDGIDKKNDPPAQFYTYLKKHCPHMSNV